MMTIDANRDDEGFSLAEVMVTMGVMATLMLLFTGALLNVYKTTSAAETLSDAQSQLARAFQSFDRELRYAAYVAQPGLLPSNSKITVVEFTGPDTTSCYQLRLDATTENEGILYLRTWTAGAPDKSTQRAIASHIVTKNVPAPGVKQTDPNLAPYFYTYAVNQAVPSFAPSPAPSTDANFVPSFQRLQVQLTSRVAAGESHVNSTFTALNTPNSTATSNTCDEGRTK